MKDKLNCPNCGAPLDGEQCKYCGTRIQERKQSGFMWTYNGVPVSSEVALEAIHNRDYSPFLTYEDCFVLWS